MQNNKIMIEKWFSSPIAIFKNENFDLTEHCLKVKNKYPIGSSYYSSTSWVHSPYTSLSVVEKETGYNSLHDPRFLGLTRWVQKCVDEFCEECGYHKMNPKDLWFNVYEKGDSQEFHNHSKSHLSCVYYADATTNDSKIIFNRDVWPMFPIPVVNPNSYNASQAGYPPEKGMLLVFKSDTMHMVEKKITDDIRISFSYNFISS